ncbi:hypothetical protein SUGI_0917590 [Cryptomeria japonica]|nr:hypothetical protein SUGI_0917590 [Cryptomeria japonica]
MQSTGNSRGAPESSPGGQLLQELEALSQALYRTGSANLRQQAGKNPQPRINQALSRFPSTKTPGFPAASKAENQNRKQEKNAAEKKSSLWDWKPLRALAHIGRQRLGCEFSLRVHGVEGLPANLNGVNLCTHWRRKDGGVKTKPARVFNGVAQFEETLYHKCSVYGSRNGPSQAMRYESKFFEIYVNVLGLEERELCRHKIDLSRMLPEKFDLGGEEERTGSWTTNFKLTAKDARGGILVVTLGYNILDREMGEAPNSNNPGRILRNSNPRLPSNPRNSSNSRNSSNPRRASVSDALEQKQQLRKSSIGVLARKPVHSTGSLEPILMLGRPDEADFDVDIIDRMSNLSLDDSVNVDKEQPDVRNMASLFDFKPRLKLFSQAVVGDCKSGQVEGSCVEEENEEFSVIEKGVEIANAHSGNEKEDKGDFKLDKDEGGNGMLEKVFNNNGGKGGEKEDEELCMAESLNVVSVKETGAGDSQLEQSVGHEQSAGLEDKIADVNSCEMGSLDDVADSVAGEFLSMLEPDKSPLLMSSDSDPDSPRARLLKQFARENLSEGGSIGLGLGAGKEVDDGPSHLSSLQRYGTGSQPNWESDEDTELASIVQAAETELQKAAQTIRSKTRAKILEDAETEALMQEWGMDEKFFQNSPPEKSGGFGSPMGFPFEGPVELPDLAEGFGPLVKTKDGGLLRSMNPLLFHNSKNNGSLVMQVSNPVVVPAEMGSNVTGILRHLAAFGIEKLTAEAKKVMPLEDITGKTIQQVALETVPSLEGSKNRQSTLQAPRAEKGTNGDMVQLAESRRMDVLSYGAGKKSRASKSSSSCMNDTHTEYVSLEDLAPQAMEKLEALSIEGLKIQSGMSDQDAPSNVSAMTLGGVAAFEGMDSNKRGSLGLEGTGGLHLLDTKESGNDSDSLLGLTITLDEWMRLDAGIVDEEETSDRTSKILAAHHCACSDLVVGGAFEGEKGDKSRWKHGTKRWGFMGNTLTIALLVQLRDPLRNFEPVGAPMMALVQAERIVVPPRPKVGRRVSDKGNSEEIDEPEPEIVKEEVSQFKITEVHVAGLKPQDENKKTGWSNAKQQQSGSRWLVASGMGKSTKHPMLKPKQGAKSMPPSKMQVKPGDTLWSISSRIHGDGGRWKEVAALNPHIRNPDVIFPNQTIRIR